MTNTTDPRVVDTNELRMLAIAYPESMFEPLTDAERNEHSSLVSRAAAAMGRHFGPKFTLCADTIDQLRAIKEEQDIEIADLHTRIADYQDERRTLEQRIAELEPNDRRYRFLRTHRTNGVAVGIECKNGPYFNEAFHSERLDELVDSAMRAREVPNAHAP